MWEQAAGEHAPWNRKHRENQDGVATTLAGFIAAALKINPYTASPEERNQIKKAHLLVARANAMQPGVFCLSLWDLVGALPVAEELVKARTVNQDYRWLNRGGVDPLGVAAEATHSARGLPRAEALYSSLPEQLADPTSFASELKAMLSARKHWEIARMDLCSPLIEPEHSGVCLITMRLPGRHLAVTALNFSREEVEEELDVAELVQQSQMSARRWRVIDVAIPSAASQGRLINPRRDDVLRVALRPLDGQTLVIVPERAPSRMSAR
jgi:trehalose synthase